MVSDYRYSVHFADGRRVTTNYMGDVLQVGDVFTFEGRNWVITDAKALSEREVDFEIHVRRDEARCARSFSRSPTASQGSGDCIT
jgi:hypothetical protein